MRLLIKYLKKQGDSDVIERVMVSAHTLKIGRGTNQDVILADARVALNHASIVLEGSTLKLSCTKGKYVSVNQQRQSQCLLQLGDQIEISGHIIGILAGTKYCDYVVQVTLNSTEVEPLKDRFGVKFEHLNLHKRRYSWWLFCLTIGLCLLLPVSGLFDPQWMQTLRSQPLPDDSQWLAGELRKAHKFIDAQCERCHVEVFKPSSEQQCLSCHQGDNQHVNPQIRSFSHPDFQQCNDCHQEHNPPASLANFAEQICTSCHRELPTRDGQPPRYGAASDFEQHHPTFKVSMLQPVVNAEQVSDWSVKRLVLADQNIKEQSNLKFSHQRHLTAEGIKSPSGKVLLECDNCHRGEKGGFKMQPVRMEQHCQGCHQLTFDVDDPERVVPHGPADEVITMMREYYAFRYIYQRLAQSKDDSAVQAGDMFIVRDARRPGGLRNKAKTNEHVLSEQTLQSLTQLTQQTIRSDALVWAESKAMHAAVNIFERQACDICHLVTKVETADNNKPVPWQVQPVALTAQWLPLADFSHQSHQSMSCNDCHNASQSESSSDVLIPNIDNCQQCHGGSQSQNLIPNTCIDCHGYHPQQRQNVKNNYHSKPLVNIMVQNNGAQNNNEH
ncbi:cytochrome c3 family protein [Thalassotalea sp. ND16A]|uniref:cytochrome c3 family protein n=1 Tax=Thalassotalea sp. ND16A TaxID=1535422 RepID=UPI00051A00F6|nr:cytochrome c3 family protein [Thalassotalea sp. ND16A]KGK01530.1 hypothetical protein ND16A_2984 [Thalassotalea sp. ND16A]